jgi:hypothetical protein
MADRFTVGLRQALRPRGILVSDDGSLQVDPTYLGADPPDPEFLRCHNELSRKSGAYSQVQRQWAQDLVTTLDRLLARSSTDPEALRAVMFLRLHGFVVDFRGQYAFAASVLSEHAPAPSSPLAFASEALAAVDALLAPMSENEQLYAEYRRHVDAHIRQGAYDLQWNRKQQAPRDQFTSKFTRKTYDVGDLNERLRTVIATHGNEMNLALALAERLRTPASRLAAAITRFCST